jgi:hypothetical protein
MRLCGGERRMSLRERGLGGEVGVVLLLECMVVGCGCECVEVRLWRW